MFSKTKTVLTAALIIGSASLGAVSAFAGDNSGEYSGGFVLPGSMDGVNPVYHPDIIGTGSQALGRAARPTVQQDRSHWGKPGYTR